MFFGVCLVGEIGGGWSQKREGENDTGKQNERGKKEILECRGKERGNRASGGERKREGERIKE